MAKFDLTNLLNNTSKENVQSARNDSLFETKMIDVEKLVESEDNFYATNDVEELARSIELLGGIEQNLIVEDTGDGKYKVIAGHRRRKAVLQLLAEGKEEYRKVPCRVRAGSEGTLNDLRLILTNSTARQLTDFEKVKQVQTLKQLLQQYKEQLAEENKDKPKEEQIRIGRIRDCIAELLDISPSQVGRMERIDKNLSDEFKEELKDGNINMSTAVSISVKTEKEQAEIYEEYKKIGEIHIKDVDRHVEKKPEKERATENIPCETMCGQEEQDATVQADEEHVADVGEMVTTEEEAEQPAEEMIEIQRFGRWFIEQYKCALDTRIMRIVGEVLHDFECDSKLGESECLKVKATIATKMNAEIREKTCMYEEYLRECYEKGRGM